MGNFHISSNGTPAPCTAQPGKCPLKEDDGQPMPHFRDAETAEKYIELKAEANEANSRYGSISKKDLKQEKSKEEKIESNISIKEKKNFEESEKKSQKSSISKLSAKQQKEIILNGDDSQLMEIAENVDDLSVTAETVLLKNHNLNSDHIEAILKNTNNPVRAKTFEKHPSARINKYMSDNRLVDPKALDYTHGGLIENSKNMNKDLYDRMNRILSERNKDSNIDNSNKMNPVFVANSLKNGSFSEDEKRDILNSDSRIIQNFVEINPDDDAFLQSGDYNKNIYLTSGERAKILTNLDPNNSKNFNVHLQEYKKDLQNSRITAESYRDKTVKESLDWKYLTETSKIRKEAGDIISKNKNLRNKDIKSIVKEASGVPDSEKFSSENDELVAKAVYHPNLILDDKRKYVDCSQSNPLIDRSFRHMFMDDKREKKFNYDESHDPFVEKDLYDLRNEDYDSWVKEASETRDPNTIRAMMIDGRFWDGLSKNNNLSETQKNYVEDHYSWMGEMRSRAN